MSNAIYTINIEFIVALHKQIILFYFAVNISDQPTSQIVVLSQSVTLTVQLSGDVVTFQWYFNDLSTPVNEGTGANGVTASGSTTATLTLSNLQISSGGEYFLRIVPVAVGATTIDSERATVTVYNVTDTPAQDVLVPLGESRVFTVTVESSPPLIYQWFVDSDLLSNDLLHISGVSTNELTINSIGTADEGAYTLGINGQGTTSTMMVSSFQVSIFICKPLVLCFSIIIDAIMINLRYACM